MKSKTVRSWLVAALLAAAPILAEEAAKPMGAPKPAPEMSQLAIFKGSWSCTGKAFANPMGPEHDTTATVKGGEAVGGMWIHLAYDEKKEAKNPAPVHAAMYMGYDAAQKKFVCGCVDSFGGYCTETSAGWNGDTLVFDGTGNMGGQKTGVRDTFVKKGETQLTHTGETQGQDGSWMKLDEETCHKSAK